MSQLMLDEAATSSETCQIVSGNRPVRAPSLPLRTLEAAWLPLEASGFLAVCPLLRALGAGDQHPVLILPGFAGGDTSTLLLRRVLRAQGHWVHAWRLGQNIGPTSRVVRGMRRRIQALHDENGKSVTLIGHSLGGVYARLLARESPESVRQVITLGSPYRMAEGDRSSVPPQVWQQLQRFHDGDLSLQDGREEDRPPLLVPATSIYSRTDGIASWQTCIDTVRENAENIEVRGSHIGMAINPAIIVAVLDRLAQPEGDWRPFAPPLGLRTWYPRPASWRDRRAGPQPRQ